MALETKLASGSHAAPSEGFRPLGPRAALNELLQNHTSLWMSLAALVGWLLLTSPARRRKKGSSDEKQYRGRRISVSKGRPAILSMGLELIVATSVKMLKFSAKSWSSQLFSNREKSAGRPVGSRRGLDANRPEGVRDLAKLEAERPVREQRPTKS